MIFVDRKRVKPPAKLKSWREQGLAELRAFFEIKSRGQRRIPFLDDLSPQWLEPPLHRLFHSKCAFCESPVEEGNPNTQSSSTGTTGFANEGVIDRYRPKERAQDIKQVLSPEHYCWLAYDWENLLLLCAKCSRLKARNFPVKGRRAPLWSDQQYLSKEKALLVDPCSPNPDSNFDFELNGNVRGTSAMGTATIELLHLNRPELVKARNLAAAEVNEAFREFPLDSDKSRTAALAAASKLVGPAQPYNAVRDYQFNMLALEAAEAVPMTSRKTRSKSRGQPRKKYQAPSWTEDFDAAVWLKKIEIENFRCFHEVAIEFPEPQKTTTDTIQEPWIMLLGENGVGKSSILKAVALALSTPAQRRRLVPRAGDCFNRNAKGGAGAIRLFFTGNDEPLQLTFSKTSEEFTASGPAPRMPLLGYGSTRLLPPIDAAWQPQPRRVKTDNLFSPHVPLADSESWLADAENLDSTKFNYLAGSLKQLLSLRDEDRIYRRAGQLTALMGKSRLDIRELSDGYQTLFALATDIMFNFSRANFDMESVAGLVLLDEIEVHLHPQWKIEVIESLRKLFPRVRFLTSTHDPLCLQGLKDGEVHVVGRMPESDRIAIRQVNVPPGLRADQLLTGFWFGLSSTRDSETIDLMNEHSALLMTRRPTASQRTRRVELEDLLQSRLTGYQETEDERIAMQALAEVHKEKSEKVSPEDRKQELKSKISKRLKARKGAS